MKRHFWIGTGVTLLLLLVVGNALAASGFKIDFDLNGTIGQANAGVSMAGGEYRLAGGYWSAEGQSDQQTQKVYLPLVTQ
jgi:hypothetical protein